MITTLDINTIVYELVTSAIGTSLTGGTYQIERPLSSQVEDIVVGTLPINESQIAVCNVNIFVPDINIQIQGKPTHVADLPRLKELTDMVLSALDQDVDLGNTYHYRVTNQSILEEPEMNTHWVNIRLELRTYL